MPAAPRVSNLARRRFPLGRLVRANLYDLLRLLHESRVALGGFALVMLAGTLYIHFAFGLRYAESLYEAFRLLTLQSDLRFPADALGIALFFLVPVLGLALILDSVFRFGRLLLDKSGRREAWQVALASTYQNHVLVCGIGRVGWRVVTQLLATGYDVVAIEKTWSSEFVARALGLKVPVVLGDAREAHVLQQAGIERARAMVVCIDADLVNVEVGLRAHSIRPDLRVILRVFNDDLDRNLEETFGRNTVFSASALAAPTYAAAAVSRDVRYVFPIGETQVGVSELVVAQESLMSGFVQKIEAEYEIRVVYHINAEGKTLAPASMRQLGSGDRVLLVGSLGALEQLRVKNVPRSKAHAALGMLPRQRPSADQPRVIVCGLGKNGYRVVRALHKLRERPAITCIYHDQTPPELVEQIARLNGVTLLYGDARSSDALTKAGLAEAYSVVALTSNDFTNMQICLAARRIRKDIHLVMRLFSDLLAEQLDDLFGIHTAYSTSALAAPTMAAAAVIGDVSAAFFSGSALYSTDSMPVANDHPFVGLSVAQVRERFDALVVSIRHSTTFEVLPAYDRMIAAGDEVTLLARLETLIRLRQARAASPVPARAVRKSFSRK